MRTFELTGVAAKAYRELEQLIVTLQLSPGSVTSEATLIEMVGLGRTPMREAIQRLAWEGLVEIRPRAGLMIAPLFASDWLRVIDARVGPEVVLARSSARFVTREREPLFRDAAARMEKAAKANDAHTFLAADKSMDEAVAMTTDNHFAARIAAPLQIHSRRFWYRFHRETGVAASAEHRIAVIRAILRHDDDDAEMKVRKLMALFRSYAETEATR
jgi:DNA-binding GntR family transcriptional regulator